MGWLDDCYEDNYRKENATRCAIRIIRNGFFNFFNYSAPTFFQRFAIIFIGLVEPNHIILGVGYSKTIQNIFGDFVLFSAVLVVNTEVGKLLGSGNYSKLSKVLYYSLFFTFFYSVLVSTPAMFTAGIFLPKITNLSKKVGRTTNRINIVCIIPILLQNLNYSLTAYLQSLGLGRNMGTINIMVAILGIVLSTACFLITNSGLKAYYLMIWCSGAGRFFVSLYFYINALTPITKINDFEIVWKDFRFVAKKMISNAIVDVFQFCNVEIVYICASIKLNVSENSAAVFVLSLYLMFNCLLVSIKRLPYMAFSEFLGLSKPHLARFCYLFSFWTLVSINLIAMIPFSLISYFVCMNSFTDDKDARKYALGTIFMTMPLSLSFCTNNYNMDMLCGLDMRVWASFWSIFVNFLSLFIVLGLDFLFRDKVLLFLLGYCAPMVLATVFSYIQIWKLDWIRQLEKIEKIGKN